MLYRATETDRCAVFVPPFAEEHNKCRRQVSETARLLAARGYSALIIDLYGTGDSEGEFSDASWSCWKEDVACAVNWATHRGLGVDAVIATRLGCVLAADGLAQAKLRVRKTVFWQPVTTGERHVKQFLRYGMAASLAKAESGNSVDKLKQRLAAGETLEIAGYPLTPALWRELQEARLSDHLNTFLGHLHILEVGRRKDDCLSPESQEIVSVAVERGLPTASSRFLGDPFWASTDIVVNTELCRQTVQIITGNS